jgi:hypothetical protein
MLAGQGATIVTAAVDTSVLTETVRQHLALASASGSTAAR